MTTDPRTVTTPEAILSYPHLFVPRATAAGKDPKYSCTLIFPEGTDLSALHAAAFRAAIEEYGEAKAMDMVKTKKLKLPFRTDWESKDGYPENSTFIAVTGNTAPGIVSRFAGPDGRPALITDPSEIYPGCRVRAQIRSFHYAVEGNRGISFGLNHIQKLGDGERLDGRTRATDAFDALEAFDGGDPFSGGSDSDQLRALMGG